MTRRRKRIPENQVKQWCRLHRDEWDFTAIAKRDGVDRRLVAQRIREYERRGLASLDETARRDLAAKKLNEHFEDLELAARSLWHLSVSPMRTGSLRAYGDDYSPRFPGLLSASRHELRQVFLVRWGIGFRPDRDGLGPIWRPQDPAPEPYESMAQREAENLITGLKEHFPNISPLIDDWSRSAQQYRETWGKLWSKMVLQDYSESDVVQALEKLLDGQMHGGIDGVCERQTEGDSEDSGVQEACRCMYRSGDVRDRLSVMTECLERLESNFTQLEEILGPDQIRIGLLKSRCSFCTIV